MSSVFQIKNNKFKLLNQSSTSRFLVSKQIISDKITVKRYTISLKENDCTPIICDINGLTDISFGFWAKNLEFFTRAPSWTEGSGGWGGTYFGINIATMEVRFGSGSSATKIQFTYSYNDNDWHHYCVVRNGTQLKFYENGQIIHDGYISNAELRNNANTFYLARGFNSELVQIDESVVNVFLFSEALTNDEVKQIYLSGGNLNIDVFNKNTLKMLIDGTNSNGNIVKDSVSNTTINFQKDPIWDVEFNPIIQNLS